MISRVSIKCLKFDIYWTNLLKYEVRLYIFEVKIDSAWKWKCFCLEVFLFSIISNVFKRKTKENTLSMLFVIDYFRLDTSTSRKSVYHVPYTRADYYMNLSDYQWSENLWKSRDPFYLCRDEPGSVVKKKALPVPTGGQATCNIWLKMADRKANNIPSSSANLLFSAAPEFNFSLPFIPVSQATGPAVLSGGELRKSSNELL